MSADVPADLVEAAARAAAIHEDYDGCFERLDAWEAATPEQREIRDVEEPMSADEEDAEWWRARQRAALAAVLPRYRETLLAEAGRAALSGAREDIRARRREFARLGADDEYLKALDDAYSLVSNRWRDAQTGEVALASDGQANICPHGSATGVDREPIGPGKVWRCDHCGLTWTDEGRSAQTDGAQEPDPAGWSRAEWGALRAEVEQLQSALRDARDPNGRMAQHYRHEGASEARGLCGASGLPQARCKASVCDCFVPTLDELMRERDQARAELASMRETLLGPIRELVERAERRKGRRVSQGVVFTNELRALLDPTPAAEGGDE